MTTFRREPKASGRAPIGSWPSARRKNWRSGPVVKIEVLAYPWIVPQASRDFEERLKERMPPEWSGDA